MDIILPFLRKVQQNDSHEWFLANHEEYLQSFSRNAYYLELLKRKIGEFDPTIAPLRLMDCSFSLIADRKLKINNRRYNDFFCGSFAQGGKYSGYASYYYQISPEPSDSGGSFLAVGIYRPNPELMDYIRREFAHNGEDIVRLIRRTGFELYAENMMKRLPSEFVDSDTRFFQYLRQRDFLLIKRLDSSWFEQENWIERAAEEFYRSRAFVKFINTVIDKYRSESPLPVGHGLRPIKRSTRYDCKTANNTTEK